MIVDKHAPKVQLKMRVNAPEWLNSDYLAHCDERSYWAKEFDKCPCAFHLREKLSSENRTKLLRDNLKQSWFEDKLLNCGNDVKKKWEVIRKFWPGKNRGTQIEEINGKVGDIDKADEINNFFCNIGPNLANDIADPCPNMVVIYQECTSTATYT